MEFNEFKANVVEELREFYGIDAEVEVTTAVKNNGVRLEGIIIRIGEANVSPVIYLEQFYKEFIESDVSIDEIVGRIVEMRESHELQNTDGMISQITNWEYVKSRVYPMLISTEGNEHLLESLVSKEFLDLSVILYVRIESIPQIGGEATVKVTVPMLENMKISEDDIFEAAICNMKNDGYCIQNLFSVVMTMMSEDFEDNNNHDRMFVYTNSRKQFGAAGLLLSEYLENQLGNQDFYIIPSSIHETLLVPKSEGMDALMLKNMVMEVNETTVASEEKLSDSVYFYSADTREISIAA